MAKSIEPRTDVLEILRGLVDGAKAGMVFGDPVSQDGVTVLPVARITGGGGGGSGTGQEDSGREGEGSGGGFGVVARPVGVFVLRDGQVSWTPAVDSTRVILGFQMLAMALLLTIRVILKRRRRRSLDPRLRRKVGPHVPGPTMKS